MRLEGRICNRCNTEKPVEDFYLRKIGIRRECIRCYLDRRKLSRHGISQDTYEKMHTECKGQCSLCKRFRKNLVIDHDHKTGAVRGLICFNCNTYLGVVEKDKTILQRISEYLS